MAVTGSNADAVASAASRHVHAIDRLLGLENDPARVDALCAAGYDCAHRIVRAGAAAFIRDMQPRIGAETAWSIYRRAEVLRSRTLHQWMRVREAVSPYARMLSARTRPAAGDPEMPLPVAPGLAVNYKAIFGEAPFADLPHDASILGPGAYFADLMALVAAHYPGQGALALSVRRPDLWNIPLTVENATGEVSQADLILEILESTAARLLPNASNFLPQPWMPDSQPGVLRMVPPWPPVFFDGSIYLVYAATKVTRVRDEQEIESAPVPDLRVSPALVIDKSVTLRGAPGMQSILLEAFELAIGRSVPDAVVAPTVVIEDCSFSFAPGATASALLRFAAGSLTLRNCVFVGNKSGLTDGWAIGGVAGSATPAGGTVTIENCTFVDASGATQLSACISLTTSSTLTLSLINSIIWPSGSGPGDSTSAAIKVGAANAVNIAHCDIFGGKSAVIAAAGAALQVAYADTNFDSDPAFAPPDNLPTAQQYAMLSPASPCIGRGSGGRNVGATFDIYAALSWAIYPFELPCDVAMEAGQLALDALEGDLAQIDFLGSQFVDPSGPAAQNVLFPLSQLGLSLADYQILQTPQTSDGALAPFFGLVSFDSESVTAAPSPTTAWRFQASKFARRLGLSEDRLRELIYQDLGPAEIAQGIQAGGGAAGAQGWTGFFINGGQTAGNNVLALRTEYVPVGRNAFNFGGATPAQQAQVTFPALAISGSFSVAFWLYPDLAQTSTLLAVGSALKIGLSNPTNSAITQLAVSSGGSNLVSIELSGFVAHPQWLSVALVYDDDALTLTLYIDGQSLGATTLQAVLAWPSGVLTAGAGLAGCLTELSLWSRALTAAEVSVGFQRPVMAQPAAASIAPAPDGLLAYWPINDGTTSTNLAILDWASSSYPGSPNNGALSAQVSWYPVGLPQNVAPAPGAGSSVLLDGLAFIQIELLSGTPPAGSSTSGGVTLGNLDRINRFTRLARRLEWTFAELDWALYALSQLSSSSGAGPSVLGAAIADLARLSLLAQRLSLGITEACTLLGPLKPFGRGRLGDQPALFDRVYNRPPLAASVFAPVMSLQLSLQQDFETPGPIARRLAAMLTLDSRQLTAFARRLASEDILVLNAATLAGLYRYRVLAGWIGLDADSFLDLVDFTTLQGFATGLAPGALWNFVLTAGWMLGGGLQPTEMRYLATPGAQTLDPYQNRLQLEFGERLPALTAQLAQQLAAWRITPGSFITPVVDPEQSASIYATAVNTGWVDGNTGLVTAMLLQQLPLAPFRVPSAEYSTINDAIQAAAKSLGPSTSSATVLIAPGYYHGTGNTDIAVDINAGCTLTIRSQGGAAATVIDGTNSTSGPNGTPSLNSFLTVAGSGSVVVDGLTVQNTQGAVSSLCPLRLANCIFRNNQGVSGGAVYVMAAATGALFEADNCVFFNNQATQGGAIYLANAPAPVVATARLYFCTLYKNSATRPGVYVDTGLTLSVEQSIVWDNADSSNADIGGPGTWSSIYSDINLSCLPGAPPPADPSQSFCADPKLLDPVNGFYGLAQGSPCAHVGTGGANIGYGSITDSTGLIAQLASFAYEQIAALEQALSVFFGNNTLPFNAVLSALGPVENGLEILVAGGDAAAGVTYLRDLYRYLLLALRFDLGSRLLARIFANPTLFSLLGTGSPYSPTLQDLRTLARFSRLRSQYAGVTDALLEYLASHANAQSSTPADSAAALASLFGWDADAVTTLLTASGGATTPLTLSLVLSVAEAIGYMQATGLDASLFLALYSDGLMFGADGVAPLIAALSAQADASADQTAAAITDLKRDLLERFVIPQINAQTPAGFPVVTASDLSDYLLIDVKMGAQTTTSRVVQATLSLQQYVQRCRLGLEPGVGLGGVTEQEWNWMSAYRTWEANRKVFLYPETYLRPDLRRDKTPLFVELERSLSGAAPTRESLEHLYKRYLDQFEILATLETVGSWYEPSRTIDSAMTAASGQGPAYLRATNQNPALYSSQLTVEAWIWTASPAGSLNQPNVLLQVQGPDDGFSFDFTTGWVDGGTTAGNQLNFTVYAGAGGSQSSSTVVFDELLQPGRWYHVAGVFNGVAGATQSAPSLAIFVDGQGSGPEPARVQSVAIGPGWSAVFGQDPVIDTDYLVNSLAEIRIWNVARSQAQILANMCRHIPSWHADFANLCGYWTFEDGAVTDLVGNWNQNIAIHGNVTFSHPVDLLTRVFRSGQRSSQYHFIGRTRTEPYGFYHRIKQTHSAANEAGGGTWGPWESIGVAINASCATPVVANGRLYVFWAETRSVSASPKATPPISAHHAVTLQYSWRNADGSWVAPQAPFAEIAVPASIELDASPAWRTPYVLPISYAGGAAILVVYGATTSNTTPVCYILEWDQSVVTGLELSGATLEGSAFAWIAPGYEQYLPLAVPPPSRSLLKHGLYVFAGQSILAGNNMDDRILGLAPPGPGSDPRFFTLSNSGQSVDSAVDLQPNLGSGSTLYAGTGNGALLQLAGTYWAALIKQAGSTTQYSVSLFVSADAQFSRSSSPEQDPVPLCWSILAGGIGGQYASSTRVALAAWSGAVYAAVSSAPTSTVQLQVLRADRATLLSGQPWDVVLSLSAGQWPSGPGPLGARLVVADDGQLYCFYLDATGKIFGMSCDERGVWNAPLDAKLSANSLSEIVLWNGGWYVATVTSSGGSQPQWSATLWSTTSLAEGGWTQVGKAIGPNRTSSFDCSLAAVPAGLIFSTSSGPSPNSWTSVQFNALPAVNKWESIGTNSCAFVPALILGQRRGPIAATLLRTIPSDAWSRPVGNQLGACTFGGSGAEFLAEANVPSGQQGAGNLMDTQVAATLDANGISLSASPAAPALAQADFSFERLTSTAVPTLAKALAQGGIEGLLSKSIQRAQEQPFSAFDPAPAGVRPPPDDTAVHFERSHPLALYYREVFFFIPWLIANQLGRNRRFAEARTLLEYIFKPSAAAAGEDYWRCKWLEDVSPIDSLTALENLDPVAVAFYRQDPFDATAIADLRPSAYQRAIVIAYIRNLIAWGDDLFAQNSRETLNQADQLYRYAADLLGPRPKRVAYTPPPPETYRELSAQMQNEFLISLEPIGAGQGISVPAPWPEGTDPNGRIADLGVYFGVPDSPEFLRNWDVVEDRLYKIRNGLDLSGAANSLPLFEPELTLNQIQRRAAGGALVPSANAGAAAPTDRQLLFPEFLLSARMLANTVVEFGSSLLRALEAQDAEGLAELQAAQQSALTERLRTMRSEEVNSAIANIESLNAALASAQYRRDFYQNQLTAGWSTAESFGVALSAAAIALRSRAVLLNTVAGVDYLWPTIFGFSNGGMSFGGALQAWGFAVSEGASMLSEGAALSNSIAVYQRRADEWDFQQKIAEYDITQIEAQIRATERQKTSAELQYQIESATQRNTRAVEEYYRGKFTNVDLYGWMADTLAQLHSQLYQVAASVAQMAQAALAAYTGTDQTFISPGGWNAQRRGLLAGESLLLDLARMEQAYLQSEGALPDVLTRNVSLVDVDPRAFLQLIGTGSCVFELTEQLFDRDHPGQYLRTLRGLSVKLRGLTQGREELNASLTRLSHDIVRQPDIGTVRFLLGCADQPGRSLRRQLRARRSALSHARAVAGVGQPEFNTDEIRAFAGGGAVSRWQLEIPPARNRLDLTAIQNVELTVQYSARHGGDSFRRDVEQGLPAYRAQVLINVARDLPDQWQAVLLGGPLLLAVESAALPRNLPGRSFRPGVLAIQAVPGTGDSRESVDVVLDIPRNGAPQRLRLQRVDSVLRGETVIAVPDGVWKEPWSVQLQGGSGAWAGLRNVYVLIEFDEV